MPRDGETGSGAGPTTWWKLEETLRAGRQAPARPGKGCNCLFSHGAERSRLSFAVSGIPVSSRLPLPRHSGMKIQMHLGLACFQVRICP